MAQLMLSKVPEGTEAGEFEDFDALNAALESARSASSLQLLESIKLLRQAKWPWPDVRLLPLLGTGAEPRGVQSVLVHSAVLKAFKHFKGSLESGFKEDITTQGDSKGPVAGSASASKLVDITVQCQALPLRALAQYFYDRDVERFSCNDETLEPHCLLQLYAVTDMFELDELKAKITQLLKERVAVDDSFVLQNVLTSDVWLYQDVSSLFHNALFSRLHLLQVHASFAGFQEALLACEDASAASMKRRLLQALCDGACALSLQLKTEHTRVPRQTMCCGYHLSGRQSCRYCSKTAQMDAVETKALCLTAPASWA